VHLLASSSSLGAELPLNIESFGLLNNLPPLPSILDTGDPIFDLHMTDILFDVILPSTVGLLHTYN